jgi:imidazolonepropionase-like amidohydrolase
MRIKGIDPDEAPESVKPAFQQSLDAFGRIITPALVAAHRPEIFLASGRLNKAVAVSTVVDGRLKTLAFVRTAQMIGCPF